MNKLILSALISSNLLSFDTTSNIDDLISNQEQIPYIKQVLLNMG